jgi:hypothetical protein
MTEETPLALYILGGACTTWALVHAARTGTMPWGSAEAFDISRDKRPILFWSFGAFYALGTVAAVVGVVSRLAGS